MHSAEVLEEIVNGPNLLLEKETEIDWATDAYRLADRYPKHGWKMDGVKELRRAAEGEKNHGEFECMASVPDYIMTALLARYGMELWADDMKVFRRWLKKHPEYKVQGPHL